MNKDDTVVIYLITVFMFIIIALAIVKQEKKQESVRQETQTYIDGDKEYCVYVDKLGDVIKVEEKEK